VHFSPAWNRVAPADLAEWILDAKLPVRLQLQQHKYIWEPAARRV
jgi:7-carboxy-7-deazaguanine synthase